MTEPISKTQTLTVQMRFPAPEQVDLRRAKTELIGAAEVVPSLLSVLEASTGELGADPRYTEKEPLGEGGMGRVLRVEDNDLNRAVARKVLLDPSQFHRFIGEAQITSQLQHPGVLPVYDFGVDRDGNLFFTMQLIESRVTLAELIRQLRAGDASLVAHYTFERRVQLIQQVCHVLEYAHERGVVHRDIKPSNIMVGEHGEVFLVDWGICKLVGDERGGAEAPQTRAPAGAATSDGMLLGTPAYMAPEQGLGDPALIDRTTDTYALCAVLYELLTLRHYLQEPLVGGPALLVLLAEAVPADAESIRDPVHGRVPRILSRVCRKGLSKRKQERFQTAAALEQVLQRWLEGNAPIVCPGTAIQRWLGRYSNAIDEHPTLVPWASIAVALTLLGGVIALVAAAFSG